MKWMKIRWPFGLSLNLIQFKKRRRNFIFKARWKYKSYFQRQQAYKKSLGKIRLKRLKVMFKNILNKAHIFKYLSLLKNIELRLDILLYRLKFSVTPFSSSVLLKKKIFLLNNNFNYKNNVICNIGDVISINWKLWNFIHFLYLSKLRLRFFRSFINIKRLTFRYKKYFNLYKSNLNKLPLVKFNEKNKSIKTYSYLYNAIKLKGLIQSKKNKIIKTINLNSFLINNFYLSYKQSSKSILFNIKRSKLSGNRKFKILKKKLLKKSKAFFRLKKKKNLFFSHNIKDKRFWNGKNNNKKLISAKFKKLGKSTSINNFLLKNKKLIDLVKTNEIINSKFKKDNLPFKSKNYQQNSEKILKKRLIRLYNKRKKNFNWKLKNLHYKRLNSSKHKTLLKFYNGNTFWKLSKQRWLKHLWWISNRSIRKKKLTKKLEFKSNWIFYKSRNLHVQKLENKKLNNFYYDVVKGKLTLGRLDIKKKLQITSLYNTLRYYNLKMSSKLNKVKNMNNFLTLFLTLFFKINLTHHKKKKIIDLGKKNLYIYKCLKKTTLSKTNFCWFLMNKFKNIQLQQKKVLPTVNILINSNFSYKKKLISNKSRILHKGRFKYEIKAQSFFISIKYFIFLTKLKILINKILKQKNKSQESFNLINLISYSLIKNLDILCKKFLINWKLSRKFNFNFQNFELRSVVLLNRKIKLFFSLMIESLSLKYNYKLFNLINNIPQRFQTQKKKKIVSIKKEIKETYKEILINIKDVNQHKKTELNSDKIFNILKAKILKSLYSKLFFNLNKEKKQNFIKKLNLLNLLNTKKLFKIHKNFKVFNKETIILKNKTNMKKKRILSLGGKNTKNSFLSFTKKSNINGFNHFSYNKIRSKKKRNFKQYREKLFFIKSKRVKKIKQLRKRKRLNFPLNNKKPLRLTRNVLLKNKHIKKFNSQLLGVKINHWYYIPSFIEMNFEILNFIIISNPLTENILTGFSYNSFLKSYIRFNKRHGF